MTDLEDLKRMKVTETAEARKEREAQRPRNLLQVVLAGEQNQSPGRRV